MARARAGSTVLAVALGLGLAACSSTAGGVPSTGGAAATAPATAAPTTTTVAPVAAVPSTTAAAPAGPPYPVARTEVPLVDRSRPTVSHGRTISASRSLPTTVWFPDRPGRWPLVVFAHGFQVGPDTYGALLEAWAAHGYVVAAPAFPLTDAAVAGSALDEGDIDNQPADVRFVTDELVGAASPVASRIDAGRVAVAGHSDGAETALAASVDAPPPGQPPYRAVIVLSGQAVPGAAGRNPPVLIAQGDADTINPPALGYGAWEQAASPKYLLLLHGGGHLPPYQPGSEWLGGIERATEAFLDAYVAGDAPAASVPASVSGDPTVALRAG